MSIVFHPQANTLTLFTRNTSYQMGIAPTGHLLHLYYGRRAEGSFDYLLYPRDCGFSPNPYEKRMDRGWSLDTLPQEYSGSCTGDYRLSAVLPVTQTGTYGAELRYVRHSVTEGKYALDGLPSAFAGEGEAETLSVVLSDPAAGLEVELLWGVYAAQDIITRAVRLKNCGMAPLRLEKAASLCLAPCPPLPGTCSIFTAGTPWSGSRSGRSWSGALPPSPPSGGCPAISTIPS